MEVDVGAYISDLLYEYEVVNLPGLGSFTGKYQPANIDHVQGKLYPPSKELAFNANLVLDDGVLMQYVQEKNLLSLEEAQRLVDDYIRKVREALNNKEIVVFPKLGRLFRDYEGQLKFVAEGVNFNTDSFGLPAVQFYPIRQLEDKPGSTTSIPALEAKKSSKETAGWVQNMIAWFDRHILYFIGVTAAFIIFVIYWFFIHPPSGQEPVELEPNTVEVPDERFNTSPSQNEEIKVITPDDQVDNQQARAGQSSGLNTEEPTVAPKQKSAIIVIGVFGDPDNATRLVQKIYQAGFEPYTEKAGNLTRIGIQMAYETDSDLQKALREVQRKFEPKARITKK